MAIKDNWTAEEYAEFMRLGQPAGWEPPRLKVAKSQKSLRPSDFSDLESGQALTRTEKRITKGRIKRTTVKRPDLGVTFASLTEERYYEFLLTVPDCVHIDIHPIFQLPGGIRYHADFITWKCRRCEWHRTVNVAPDGTTHKDCPDCEVMVDACIDVKGRKTLTTAFKRIRRLFDAHHPLAPLRVVVWDRQAKKWEEI